MPRGVDGPEYLSHPVVTSEGDAGTGDRLGVLARGRPARGDRVAQRPGWSGATSTRPCSASPARGSRSRSRAVIAEGAAAHDRPGARTRASPRSSPASSGSCSRRTGSSTSSPTTTTTSPRRTSRRPTPTSRRTRRSTTRSTGCATRPRARSCRRRDVIIVASVSAIYGLGAPETYAKQLPDPRGGGGARPAGDPRPPRRARSTSATTSRSSATSSGSGATRSRSTRPTRSARCACSSSATRSSGSAPSTRSPARSSRTSTGSCCSRRRTTSRPRSACARRSRASRPSCDERLAWFEEHGKLLEAQRLRMRTTYDLEMLREVGSCSGIENYSRHLDGRSAGQAPYTLLDYFPDDYLVVLDESHVTVPQLHGQYEGDRSRKETLVEHGFRLPSAMDNRPLRFDEFIEKVNQVVFLSATPGPVRARGVEPGRRADRAADRSGRPRGDRAADEGPDRRPRRRDPRPRGARPARARHDADQEDGRGPHRLPDRARDPGAVPAQRGRHAGAGRDPAVAAARRVRRARRHQPAAGGSRPPRGRRSSPSSTPTRRASSGRRRR